MLEGLDGRNIMLDDVGCSCARVQEPVLDCPAKHRYQRSMQRSILETSLDVFYGRQAEWKQNIGVVSIIEDKEPASHPASADKLRVMDGMVNHLSGYSTTMSNS